MIPLTFIIAIFKKDKKKYQKIIIKKFIRLP